MFECIQTTSHYIISYERVHLSSLISVCFSQSIASHPLQDRAADVPLRGALLVAEMGEPELPGRPDAGGTRKERLGTFTSRCTAGSVRNLMVWGGWKVQRKDR